MQRSYELEDPRQVEEVPKSILRSAKQQPKISPNYGGTK